MLENAVALWRVKQIIAWRGNTYSVYRHELNEYNEKSGAEPELVKQLKAFFFDGSAEHQYLTLVDGAVVQAPTVPYLLAVWADSSDLMMYDFVEINSKKYRVNSIINVQERNLVAIVSLDVEV